MSLQVLKCPTCGSELVKPSFGCNDPFHILKPSKEAQYQALHAAWQSDLRQLVASRAECERLRESHRKEATGRLEGIAEMDRLRSRIQDMGLVNRCLRAECRRLRGAIWGAKARLNNLATKGGDTRRQADEIFDLLDAALTGEPSGAKEGEG